MLAASQPDALSGPEFSANPEWLMEHLSTICWYCIAGAFIGQLWFAWDMRSILKSSQQRQTLAIEGRWSELEAYLKRAAKTYRPFVWLHHRYLLPGTLAVHYALFLNNQGRHAEALTRVDEAIWQLEHKPRIFHAIHRSATLKVLSGALKTRILALTGMGRYDDARQTAARLQHLPGSSGQSNAALAPLEYKCGRLDEALARAEATSPGDAQFDSARGIMSLAYCMKGEFDRAVQVLAYEPSDIAKFYSPGGLEAVSATSEGRKLIHLQRQKYASVFLPARLLFLAHAYLAQQTFEPADRALDQAEKLLGPQPGLQSAYCRYRARSAAAQGKKAEAEQFIERMRSIVQQTPKRSLLWEFHYTTGSAYWQLKQYQDALAELAQAQQLVLHPIEKHVTVYRLAQAYEDAGDPHQAIAHYRTVAADVIPSWMRAKAAEALSRLQN